MFRARESEIDRFYFRFPPRAAVIMQGLIGRKPGRLQNQTSKAPIFPNPDNVEFEQVRHILGSSYMPTSRHVELLGSSLIETNLAPNRMFPRLLLGDPMPGWSASKGIWLQHTSKRNVTVLQFWQPNKASKLSIRVSFAYRGESFGQQSSLLVERCCKPVSW